MSNFLKLVQEVTAAAGATGSEPVTTPPASKTSPAGKKPGILNKVVSGVQKISSAIDTINKYGTGKWDINDTLQGILSKQLDKSTDKMGLFGKSKYSQIKLGEGIVTKINNYIGEESSDADAGVEGVSQEGDSVTSESTLNGNFLRMVGEATAVVDKDKEGKFKNTAQMKGGEKGKSVKLKVWDVLKDALALPDDASITLKNPDPQMSGKKVVDRRVDWITKGVPAFLKNIKDEYPDIPFTYEGHSKDDGLSVSAIGQEEEEFNFMDTTRQDWIKTLGAEKAEKIVRGLVDIYPGDRIVFEEPVEDAPVKLTNENAIFNLAGRTSFGAKGIQWTLKPQSADVADILAKGNIKYVTYLLQTPDNSFKAPERNTGIIYAYDENNQPINSITTKDVRFQWNGQEGLYTLSTNNNELMGVKYSEGQFPIGKDEVMPLTDGKHILYRPDENSAYFKFKIIQDMNDAGKYLIDKDKGIAATEQDIKEAEANADR